MRRPKKRREFDSDEISESEPEHGVKRRIVHALEIASKAGRRISRNVVKAYSDRTKAVVDGASLIEGSSTSDSVGEFYILLYFCYDEGTEKSLILKDKLNFSAGDQGNTHAEVLRVSKSVSIEEEVSETSSISDCGSIQGLSTSDVEDAQEDMDIDISRDIETQDGFVDEASNSMGSENVIDIGNREQTEATEPGPKSKKSKPLRQFMACRFELLDELLRHEAPPDTNSLCKGCMKDEAGFRCSTCFTLPTLCAKCLVAVHGAMPLHRIEVFNGLYWERSTLNSLGLVINLGHGGSPCPEHSLSGCSRCLSEVTVLGLDGIQTASIRYCCCSDRLGPEWEHRGQLMRAQLFPATFLNPGTVATFALLDLFMTVTSQGKLSGYDFYKAIVALTDNSSESVKRRYEEFMSMARQYQHLKMLQRAGIFKQHNPLAYKRLAVECPACPHPERNLPDNWKEKIDSWIYTLYVMVDANFKLKQKAKRSRGDPDLADGMAYFVEDSRYKEHLENNKHEKEIKYCSSGLKAVEQADVKGSQDYDATGVVAVQCRHMLIMGNGVGDLQKGERYCNVDYVLLSALSGIKLRHITISYDIACQYSRNFKRRVPNFPSDMELDLEKVDLKFVIPVFHITGHDILCQTRFSLHYREHMAKTDGENIERGWAAFNPASMQVKEMGSGSRRDLLNLLFAYWNWQRILRMGIILLNRLKEALKERKKETDAHDGFSLAFPSDVLAEIDVQIQNWNRDPMNSPDPYREESKHNKALIAWSQSQSKQQREEDDSDSDHSVHRRTKKVGNTNVGETQSKLKAVTGKDWIAEGLRLEQEILEVKQSYKDLEKEGSGTKYTAAENRNLKLLGKIRLWQLKQPRFMPGLINWEPIPEIDEDEAPYAWEVELVLPSSIPPEERSEVCPHDLAKEEFIIREVKAYEALEKIRVYLLQERIERNKKQIHNSGVGQRIVLRAYTSIKALEDRREEQVVIYRRMWDKMKQLDPEGSWDRVLEKLHKDQVVVPFTHVPRRRRKTKKLNASQQPTSQNSPKPAWFWNLPGAAVLTILESNDEEEENMEENTVDPGLRVEWAKSKARRDRWMEEVVLVNEEMRRVLVYFEWKAAWWLKIGSGFVNSNCESERGVMAYGNKQASILKNLAKSFRTMWLPYAEEGSLPEWRK